MKLGITSSAYPGLHRRDRDWIIDIVPISTSIGRKGVLNDTYWGIYRRLSGVLMSSAIIGDALFLIGENVDG